MLWRSGWEPAFCPLPDDETPIPFLSVKISTGCSANLSGIIDQCYDVESVQTYMKQKLKFRKEEAGRQASLPALST